MKDRVEEGEREEEDTHTQKSVFYLLVQSHIPVTARTGPDQRPQLRNSIPVSHMGSRGSSILAILQYLPRHFSRKLDWEQKSWDRK